MLHPLLHGHRPRVKRGFKTGYLMIGAADCRVSYPPFVCDGCNLLQRAVRVQRAHQQRVLRNLAQVHEGVADLLGAQRRQQGCRPIAAVPVAGSRFGST